MWILLSSNAPAFAHDDVVMISGPGPTNVQAILPTDVDEDGDVDLILGGVDFFGYLENDTPAPTWPLLSFDGLNERQLFPDSPGADEPIGYEQLDADGDGRSDVLVIARADQLAILFAADGFASATPLLAPLETRAYDHESNDAAGTDLDGDGDIDIVVAEVDGYISWLENLGGGVFAEPVPVPGAVEDDPGQFDYATVVAADFDADGDNDVVYSADNTGTAWLRNDGSTFTHLVVDQNLVLSFDLFNPVMDSTRVADIDDDGFPDISHRLGVLFANGNGFDPFSDLGVIRNFDADDALPIDLDGDGLLDILSANHTSDVQRFDNLGNRQFVEGDPLQTEELDDHGFQFAAAYVDSDGVDDAIFGGASSVAVALVLAGGPAAPVPLIRAFTSLHSLHVADIDGDGKDDLLATGSENRVMWHPAQPGGLSALSILLEAGDASDHFGGLATLDVDSDGDLDLLTGFAGSFTWHPNEGAAGFGASIPVLPGVPAEVIVVRDFTGDGLLDAVAATNLDLEVAFWLYEGDGTTFIDGVEISPVESHGPKGRFDAGDMDGDADIDIVVANELGTGIDWIENLGAGTFAPVAPLLPFQGAISDDFQAPVAADFDADGDLDLVVVNKNHGLAADMYYAINSGSGTFDIERRYTVTVDPCCPERFATNTDVPLVTDVDRDGDLDAMMSVGIGGSSPEIALFPTVGDRPGMLGVLPLEVPSSISHFVAGDFNLDGTPEFVGASAGACGGSQFRS